MEMKYLALYGGCALIGAVTQVAGIGWIKPGGRNLLGAFVNILACLTWCGIIYLLSSKKKSK
jgi:hypothetical protein